VKPKTFHFYCEKSSNVKQMKKQRKVFSITDALQGLEAVRKYIQQSDVQDDILVMDRKFRNKFYALKHQEKCKQITKLDRIKK